MVSQRDAIRTKIFDAKNRKKIVFTLWDTEIELKQPPLGEVLKAQDNFGENRQSAIADILIQYCYVPGTDERVFEDADRDSILNLPVGPDLRNLNAAIAELLGLETKEAEKNLEKTTGGTTPS